MNNVQSITIQDARRGIDLIFKTDNGEIQVHLSKKESRELMKRLFRKVGMVKGDTEI